MLELLGRFAFHRRWLIICLWAAALILGVALPVDGQPLVTSLPRRLTAAGFEDPTLESQRVAAILERELGQRGSVLVVIFHDDEGVATDARFARAVADALASVEQLPVVEGVVSPYVDPRQISDDGHTAFALVALHAADDDGLRAIDEVAAALRDSPIRAIVAGGPTVYRDIVEVSERDLRRAEVVSFPLALIALVVVFGSVVAAGVPVAIGGVSVGIALVVIGLLTYVTELSIFVLNLTTMLGLGLGTDYSLLMVSRFREELEAARRHGHREVAPLGPALVEEAVARTMTTAGRAVLFSGGTVCIGLLGLTLMRFPMLRSLGMGGAVVVALAVAAALTLLPAILAALGSRVDALPILRRGEQRQTALWQRLAAAVMRRPWTVIVIVLVMLGALGAPFRHARLSLPDAAVLPPDVPSRQGYELIRQQFGDGEVAAIQVIVRASGPVLTPERLDALYDLSRFIARDPEVARVDSIVDLDPRLTREQYQILYRDGGKHADAYARGVLGQTTTERLTLLTVIPRHTATTPEALALVDRLRALRPSADLEIAVGGGPAAYADIVDQLYRDFPRTIVFMVATTYLILLVLFRSVLLPIKAILMNCLSLVASYGALVVVFQDGLLYGMLGLPPLGYVEATLPIIMFCLLFGLSMDYEVFLLTRIKEAHDAGASNLASVGIGLERSGRVVTNAALIVVLVALSFFATADIMLIKALGLGTALAVLIDATVVRALLVPATMRLLGDLNWWAPTWLIRMLRGVPQPAHGG